MSKKAKRSKRKITVAERNYKEVSGVGQAFTDWAFTTVGADSDLWQNAWALTARCRDLFRTNPYFQKYREILIAGVYGGEGTMMRAKIMETEPRIVHAPDEKMKLMEFELRINRLREWAEKRTGCKTEQYRAFKLADALDRASHDDVLRGVAMIQVGQPDVYANFTIEKHWINWQKAMYCDIRRDRNYNTLRQLRLINAAQDGDIFIRRIKRPKINDYGYTLQLISAEWCDRWYNTVLDNGNVVIMGIEYEMTPEGLGPKVAYYMIKRQPMDWQFTVPGSFNFSSGNMHIRMPADEIIHFARPVDAESTRPAPWVCAAIPQARQLSEYEIAEVIAARKEACSTGVLYSDIAPTGGEEVFPIDPRKAVPGAKLNPGDILALPYGVKYQGNNPTHPTMNYPGFRKGQGQTIAAALPGGDYNVIFNDLSSVNFSAGRLGRLDKRDTIRLLQKWDEEKAERVIFEDFLEMGMITGKIPLPVAKFNKFNNVVFQGPSGEDVDEVKAVNSAALRVANKFSSRGRECANNGMDFEEIVFELAEEEMLLESLGLATTTTVESVPAAVDVEDETEGATDTSDTTTTTAEPSINGNGKKPKKSKSLTFSHRRF